MAEKMFRCYKNHTNDEQEEERCLSFVVAVYRVSISASVSSLTWGRMLNASCMFHSVDVKAVIVVIDGFGSKKKLRVMCFRRCK